MNDISIAAFVLFCYWIISTTYVAHAEDIPVWTWPALMFTVLLAITILIHSVYYIVVLCYHVVTFLLGG